MEDLGTYLLDLLRSERAVNILQALLTIAVGLLVAKLVSRGVVRLFAKQADTHQAMLLRRASFYLVAGLFIASALVEAGLELGVLLGAAGVLTVAIGFASQTSASNVISGLFLLGEKAFTVGEIIRIGDTTGEVLSVDLMSVKLRTFDNLYVRVPNENLVKSQIINLSRFPIRRVDIQLGVAYREDLNRVREILFEVADRNPLCLEEPQPLFLFQGYGDSALTFQFSVWAKRENFLELRTSMQIEIKEAFDRHGIEIPFPHRTLYTGDLTQPFPVRVVSS